MFKTEEMFTSNLTLLAPVTRPGPGTAAAVRRGNTPEGQDLSEQGEGSKLT